MDSSRALAAGPRGSLCVLCWFIRSHLRSGSILACSLASRLTNSSQLLVATLVVLQADSIVLCRSRSLLGLCVESYCPSHRLNLDSCSAHRRSLVPKVAAVSPTHKLHPQRLKRPPERLTTQLADARAGPHCDPYPACAALSVGRHTAQLADANHP